MPSLDFVLDDLNKTIENLKQFKRQALSADMLGKKTESVVFEANRENLLSRGGRGGTTFREKADGSPATLFKSGVLLDAISGKDRQGIKIERIKSIFSMAFTEPNYLAVQQKGTRNQIRVGGEGFQPRRAQTEKGGKAKRKPVLPPRPVVGLIQSDADAIANDYKEGLEDLYNLIFQ
jgi:hypothetical protein